MVQINFARKEINCKIVYYGPGLSGKTTSLEVVHQRTPQGHKGELTSISTDGDRTLFFDFMPLDLGTIAGMKVKFHLYTVPGQVYYNSTRKLVLLGADGIIFVADSTPGRMEDNQQSMDNLRENLTEMQRDLNKIPHVIQWNKRDLPSPVPVAELEQKLNPNKVPTFETSARTGDGIFQALKSISALVLEDINSSDRAKGGSVAGAAKKQSPPPVVKTTGIDSPAPATGHMPEKAPNKVLRPTAARPAAAAASAAPPAAAPAAAPAPVAARPAPARAAAPAAAPRAAAHAPAPAATATLPPPAAPAHEARPAPVAAARPQARGVMNDSKEALKHEVRQMAQPRASAAAPAPASGGGSKLVAFMLFGLVAGAIAAVAAAKFLLGF